jgi:hypothetical protein
MESGFINSRKTWFRYSAGSVYLIMGPGQTWSKSNFTQQDLSWWCLKQPVLEILSAQPIKLNTEYTIMGITERR